MAAKRETAPRKGNGFMIRRYSIGAFFTLAAALLAVVGLSVCLANVRGGYLALTSAHSMVVRCLSAAAVLEMLALLVGMRGTPSFADFFPAAASALLTFGASMLIMARIEMLLSLFFSNGVSSGIAWNAAALNEAAARCLVETGCCLMAVLNSILGAFFDVTVEMEPFAGAEETIEPSGGME